MKKSGNTESAANARTKVIFILFLGLLLRLLLAPFTLNWDLLANTTITNSWGRGTLEEFYQQPLAAYPPLLYMVTGVMLRPVQMLGHNFPEWLAKSDFTFLKDSGVFRNLLLLKLPYIAIELAAGYVFSKLFSGKNRLQAWVIWLLNPITIFVVTVWTSVDIIPLLFMLLAIYFFEQKKLTWAAALSLGIAGAFKLFPLFAVPFFLLAVKDWRGKLLSLIAIAVPVILVHLPVLPVPAYWEHAVAGGYREQVLFAAIGIGLERSLLLYPLFYLLLFFATATKRLPLLVTLWLPFIPMFALSKFNLQWLLWLLPLLAAYRVWQRRLTLPETILYAAYCLLILLSQASLNIGMLAPLEPTFWLLEWPLKSKLGTGQITLLLNAIQSILAAALVYLGYQLYQRKDAYEQS